MSSYKFHKACEEFTSETAEKCSSASFPFLGLLTILFIGLKLTGHIDWSWFWVLSPLAIPFSVLIGVTTVCLLVWSSLMLWELKK